MGAYILIVWILGITGIAAYWLGRLTWWIAKKVFILLSE